MKMTEQPSSVSGSEGTKEMSQPRSGWFPAPQFSKVPKGRRTFPDSNVLSGRNFLWTIFQPRRGWLISGCRFATQFALFAVIMLFAPGAAAQTTDNLSEAEIHGRQLAQQILELRPSENFTNSGVLIIHPSSGKQLQASIKVETVAGNDWRSHYSAELGVEKDAFFYDLLVIHSAGNTNDYRLDEQNIAGHFEKNLAGKDAMIPFANSDFWLCDLGLEYFHWPDQKILRGETMRGVFCKVLESTNPNPSTNGYSRVVSWIDNDSLGIVQAKAYDVKGNPLKEFYPKDIQKDKATGQWQVGTLEIDNVQTHSRTRLIFDTQSK